MLQANGELAEADQILRRTLTAQNRVLGPEHKDTRITAGNLRKVEREQGKRDALAKEKEKEEEKKAQAEREREKEERDEEDGTGRCSICLDASADWVFEACGHKCICKSCVRKQKEKAQLAAGAAGKKKTGRRKPVLVPCPLCRVETRVVPSSRHEGDVYE